MKERHVGLGGRGREDILKLGEDNLAVGDTE